MTIAEIRHEQFVKETENKIRLLRIGRFLKDYEYAKANPDPIKPAPPDSDQTVLLVRDIRDLFVKGKKLRLEVEEAQRELKILEDMERKKKKDDVSKPDLSYMYPVPPDVKRKLYHGISSYGEGRYDYLKHRKSVAPADKYRACPTHNFRYGWNYESMVTGAKPEYPYFQSLREAMYSIHGATLYMGHPPHQRPPFDKPR